jgi:palmitoyltransferase ZDHHC6
MFFFSFLFIVKNNVPSADGGLTPDVPIVWPPREPATDWSGQNPEFTLPSSPWTYENGSLNPDLKPYNAHLRTADIKRRHFRDTDGFKSSVPPYHPDFPSAHADALSPDPILSSDSDTYQSETENYAEGSARVRRGSEGYEVRPLNREEMLRHYVQDQVTQPGRYQVYAPEPGSETEAD